MIVRFFKPTTIYGKLVCLVTRGIFSHVDIVFDYSEAFESNKGYGVRTYKTTLVERPSVSIHLRSEFESKMEEFLKGELGCGYDYLGVLRYILPFLGQSKNRWYCTELVAAALMIDPRFAHFWNYKDSPTKLNQDILRVISPSVCF